MLLQVRKNENMPYPPFPIHLILIFQHTQLLFIIVTTFSWERKTLSPRDRTRGIIKLLNQLREAVKKLTFLADMSAKALKSYTILEEISGKAHSPRHLTEDEKLNFKNA